MKAITFSLLVLAAVVSIALAHPTPHFSSAPSSIESELVPATAAPTLAAPTALAAVETPQDLVDKRNYHVQTTTAEAPEVTYPAELWPKYKHKRDHKDTIETEPANSIDTSAVWDTVERPTDENGPSSTPRHTAKPPKTMTTSKPEPKLETKTKSKSKSRTKQPPVKPTRAPKSPPRPNLPPPVPTPPFVPSTTPSSAPAPGPGSAEPNPPTEPPTGSAMISNNAPKPEKCRSVTLTWKIFIDRSDGQPLPRWRHEISYIIDRGSSNSLTFLGGRVVQDEKTNKIGENNEQSTQFSSDGDFGVRITPVGQGTRIVWYWRGQTREFSKPNAIVPYSGDDMKYGYEYWDCVPASW